MVGITVEVIANNAADPNAVFFAGKFINGLAIGGLITTVMSYVSDKYHRSTTGVYEHLLTHTAITDCPSRNLDCCL